MMPPFGRHIGISLIHCQPITFELLAKRVLDQILFPLAFAHRGRG
jgi:hypothetical protein